MGVLGFMTLKSSAEFQEPNFGGGGSTIWPPKGQALEA